ncbi:CHAT domain-containing protein [Micromonospora sp. WMMD882]|uniref:CHAT domain-containing protein n=1 Tax=Micromonospora sp. WMMD882 TaxID=3015151 RepID=UPI00248D0CAA|nr:CHAT domain-containing protein [Micromonospora sp. WMMD882]WBB79548.1 CHAT domain-containing protein [Micromonospora sp. WMMD882]
MPWRRRRDPAPSEDTGQLAESAVARFDEALAVMRHVPTTDTVQAAIEAGRRAAAEDGPDRAWALGNLGGVLRAAFALTGDLRYLDEAITGVRRASALVPADGPDRARLLDNLGTLLFSRFQHTSDRATLTAAIEASRAAVVAEGSHGPVRADRRCNLVVALAEAHQQTGDLAALDEAVDVARAAVAECDGPDGDQPTAARCLHYLAFCLRRRHRTTGARWALDEAIEAARRAVAATPSHEPGRLDRMTVLHAALGDRFAVTGARADLAEQVSVAAAAEAITPPGHPAYFDNRERLRAGREALARLTTGRAEPAADATDATDRAGLLADICGYRTAVFQHTRDLSEIERAVAAGREAVAATPPGHPDQARRLDNLGVALGELGGATGDPAVLVDAVAVHRRVVAATAPDHPHLARRLGNLAAALHGLFAQTRDEALLEEAVSVGRRAAETADDPGEQAVHLSNLCAALHRRYLAVGEVGLLAQAVDAGRAAARLGADRSARHGSHLSNLGAALVDWSRHTGRSGALEEAVRVHEAAVAASGERHPDRALRLSNLGGALLLRYERAGDPADLYRCVVAHRAALAAAPADSPERAHAMIALAGALVESQSAAGGGGPVGSAPPTDGPTTDGPTTDGPTTDDTTTDDTTTDDTTTAGGPGRPVDAGPALLDEAVTLARAAVDRLPADTPTTARGLSALGDALGARFRHSGDEADLDGALAAYRRAVAARTAPLLTRVAAANAWGMLAADADRVGAGGAQAAAEGFATAVRLLPRLAGRHLSRPDAQHWLARFGGLAADAAAWALTVGDEVAAVTLLELGRGVLLAQALDTRTDLTDLAAVAPDLVDRFTALAAELDAEATVRDRLALAAELDTVLGQLRALPGGTDVLDPPSLAELTGQAADGPVVLINVSRYRCDALLLTADGLRAQRLPGLTAGAVRDRVTRFHSALADGPGPATERVVRDTLTWLWDAVVGPVLDGLGHTGAPSPERPWPRVWWVPVGSLGLLPLAAAGRHHPAGANALDRVVSSVVPTVRALGHARSRARRGRGGSPPVRPLVVAMPHTPDAPDLPGADAEAALLRDRLPGAMLLVGADAVRSAVLAALPTATWAHFACHGHHDPQDPSESRLLLADHADAPLRVPDVARLRLTDAAFAYLSACDTARTAPGLSDEAIHPASAFQQAGFPQVVGTLWQTDDQVSIDQCRSIYDLLLAGEPDPARAAYAVHRTTRRLRDRYPNLPSTWAGLLHVGG